MASTPYIIAEIGTSHQGDKTHLEELISAAVDSGADCAKFQWVIADEIIHPLTGDVPLPTGKIRLFDRFRELEVDEEFYRLAQSLCASRGIDFLCTPFGARSADGLHRLGVTAYKIASPELNHLPLVRQLAEYRKPLIVSSGVSTLADIDETISLVHTVWHDSMGNAEGAATGNSTLPPLTLLHCITAYPAPEEDFNILLIRTLADIFGVPTGLSDHSLDPVLVPALSVLLGGSIVEKHFTLSNDTSGLDDPIALAPVAFRTMVEALATIHRESWIRDIKEIRDKSLLVSKLRKFLGELGKKSDPEQIAAILGSGVKRLADAEVENYGRTNRSIHALRDLPRGHRIIVDDIAVLRTEKILRPGLHPRYHPIVVGRICRIDIPAGEGVRWQDLA